jgi:hypothetical protein
MYTVRVSKQQVDSPTELVWENLAQVDSVADFDKEFSMAKSITTDVLHDWKHVQLVEYISGNIERYWLHVDDNGKKDWFQLFPRSVETDKLIVENYKKAVASLPFYKRWYIKTIGFFVYVAVGFSVLIKILFGKK